MTYNVRSCRGLDGITSPERVAEVMAGHAPDLAALQELDMGQSRSAMAYQAREIADVLQMDFHFHPTLRMHEGQYGNAIFSRFPMKVIKAGGLPTLEGRKPLEKRGALWARIELPGGSELDMITTHMGLVGGERMAQARELSGPGWLRSPERKGLCVFCGDLNTIRQSVVHRVFRSVLKEAREDAMISRPTYPSRMPLMRLDHIFVSPEITVDMVTVPRGRLDRVASDHLPVLAEVSVPLDTGARDKGTGGPA